MDVRLPNGLILKNVPDGTSQTDIINRLKANGMPVDQNWVGAQPPVPEEDTGISKEYLGKLWENVKSAPEDALNALKTSSALTQGILAAPLVDAVKGKIATPDMQAGRVHAAEESIVPTAGAMAVGSSAVRGIMPYVEEAAQVASRMPGYPGMIARGLSVGIPVVAGLATAIPTGYGLQKGQEALLEKFPEAADLLGLEKEKRAKERAADPYGEAVASALPGFGFATPGTISKLSDLTYPAVNAGIQGVINIGSQLWDSDGDWSKVQFGPAAVSAALGAAQIKPTSLGEATTYNWGRGAPGAPNAPRAPAPRPALPNPNVEPLDLGVATSRAVPLLETTSPASEVPPTPPPPPPPSSGEVSVNDVNELLDPNWLRPKKSAFAPAINTKPDSELTDAERIAISKARTAEQEKTPEQLAYEKKAMEAYTSTDRQGKSKWGKPIVYAADEELADQRAFTVMQEATANEMTRLSVLMPGDTIFDPIKGKHSTDEGDFKITHVEPDIDLNKFKVTGVYTDTGEVVTLPLRSVATTRQLGSIIIPSPDNPPVSERTPISLPSMANDARNIVQSEGAGKSMSPSMLLLLLKQKNPTATLSNVRPIHKQLVSEDMITKSPQGTWVTAPTQETANVQLDSSRTGLPTDTASVPVPVLGGTPTESGVAGTQLEGLGSAQQVSGRTNVGEEPQPRPLMPLNSIVPTAVGKNNSFKALADAQRDKPENAMLRAVFAMQKQNGIIVTPEGYKQDRYPSTNAYGHILEHVGDLTHRMSEDPNSESLREGLVLSKVNTGLRILNNADHRENIKNIPRIPELQKYADAHRELPVYNRAQQLARDSAVALGEGRLNDARTNLTQLKGMIDSGEYIREAAKYDPNFESNVPRSPIDLKHISNLMDRADNSIPEASEELISNFVGHEKDKLNKLINSNTVLSPGQWDPEFGVMDEHPLERVIADPNNPTHAELYNAFEPYRKELRQKYGNTIPLYRVQKSLSDSAKKREVLSYTADKDFAHYYGNVRKALPFFDEAAIRKFEAQYEKTGRVDFPGTNYSVRKEAFHIAGRVKDLPMIYWYNEPITDTESIRTFVTDSLNKDYKEREEQRANALKNIVKHDVPIDDIVWATNRAGQHEFIVRNRGEHRFGPNSFISRAPAYAITKAQTPESLRLRVGELTRFYKDGKLTAEQYAAEVERAYRETKKVTPIKDRVRGMNRILEVLNQGVRAGIITPEAEALASWFMRKNPALVDDLAMTFKQDLGGSAGNYNPIERLVSLLKGSGQEETALHEILHHLERMMPEDIKDAIRAEWRKQLTHSFDTTKDPALREFLGKLIDYHFGRPDGSLGSNKLMKEAIEMIRDGRVPNLAYQFVNSSEFWAVRGSDIMSRQFEIKGPIIGKLRQWLNSLWQKLKSLFGLSSDSPILKAMDSLIKGDGKFISFGFLSTVKMNRFDSIRRKNSIFKADPLEDPAVLNPDPEDVLHGEEFIAAKSNAQRAEGVPKIVKKFKRLVGHEAYERYATEYQNNARPWKTLGTRMEREGTLIPGGPNANDVYNVLAHMDSVAADYYIPTVVDPAIGEFQLAIKSFMDQSKLTPELAMDTVSQMLEARSATVRRNELYRRYVPLRQTGATILADGNTVPIAPAQLRTRMFKQVRDVLGDVTIDEATRREGLTKARKIIEAITDNSENHDSKGQSYHPYRPVDREGHNIAMPTSLDSKWFAPAEGTATVEMRAVLKVMNDYLTKYPALQEVFDAYGKVIEATKTLKREAGTWTHFMDDVIHFYGWGDNYAPLSRDRGDMDPLNLEGARNSGHVSGIQLGMVGGDHKTTNVVEQVVYNLRRAAVEASRGGIVPRIKNMIDKDTVRGLGEHVATIPAKDVWWNAFERVGDPDAHPFPESLGGNKITYTLPNGDKEIYRIDRTDLLDSIRRPYKELGPVQKFAKSTMGVMASQHTHLKLAFAPWNFMKHTLMNAQIMSINDDLSMGPIYLAKVMANLTALNDPGKMRGISMYNLAKLYKDNDQKLIAELAEKDPFIQDAMDWLRLGGRAAYAHAQSVENTGKEMIALLKTNPFIDAKDVAMQFLDRWNMSWDLLSRVTAFGLYKQRFLAEYDYADAIKDHGRDSPQALRIVEKAEVMAANKAKELANFSLYGEKGKLMSMVYMFFRPAITTNVAVIDALRPIWQNVDKTIEREMSPEDRDDPEKVANFKQKLREHAQRGMIVVGSLYAAGLMMYGLARMMSPKDSQGRNIFANSDKAQMLKSMQIPIFNTGYNANLAYGFGTGGFIGLGAQHAAYLFGDQTGKDAVLHSLDLFMEAVLPILPSHIDPSKNFWAFVADSLAFSQIKPGLEFAMNKDSLGHAVTNIFPNRFGSVNTGGSGIPQMFKDAATFMHEKFETTIQPNELYFLFSNYMDAYAGYASMIYNGIQAVKGDFSGINPKALLGSFISKQGNVDERHYSELKPEALEAKQRLATAEINPQLGAEYRKRHPTDQVLVQNFFRNQGVINELSARRNEANITRMPPQAKRALVNNLTEQINVQKRIAVESAKPVAVTPIRPSKP